MSDTDKDAGDGGNNSGFEAITSQEDFDRRIQDRIARVKTTPPDDYDDLKKKAAKLDELEAANATELDKATARAEKAEKERDDALASAKDTRIDAAVIAAAAKKNIVDPDAALALLDRKALTLDADGKPTNVDEVLGSLLEAKPYLAGANGGRRGNADQGAREGGAGNAGGVEAGSLTDILLRSTERA